MDEVLKGLSVAVGSAVDAVAIAFGGYTTKEQRRIEQLMDIFDDMELCKMIVRIESGKRNIGLTEIKEFNTKLQEMEVTG
ncbi:MULTISPECIES: hypothetical protein [Latilactobacillus]|uniref:Uncharacterized protein n=1 Tax=Latilactobacillus curvatus TaxID=28038 RepID=A0A385AEY8_LATCU|nr:hypothetical protein [Latilactobacillus curvatus]AWV73282.1 hypothetical protein C0W45_06875 [Latilactobacillus curvatus]AXN36207.1 hypothetical protein DT351_07420 [Latilactobacillus curvatus]MDG2980291.1 hypothetical protein [Latilactobacillus curvatus]WCZ54945.1 hypothetical protein [Latilactobacillus phage TMW 1.1365 P1]